MPRFRALHAHLRALWLTKSHTSGLPRKVPTLIGYISLTCIRFSNMVSESITVDTLLGLSQEILWWLIRLAWRHLPRVKDVVNQAPFRKSLLPEPLSYVYGPVEVCIVFQSAALAFEQPLVWAGSSFPASVTDL